MSKKGRIAEKKLEVIKENINVLSSHLENVREGLKDVIGKDVNEAEKVPIKKTPLSKDVRRIEFEKNRLTFYIEFTMVNSDNDELVEHEGRIIYGVNRTLCYKNCIMPSCFKWCQNLSRCDALEDKPLAQFSIDPYGRIQSKNNIEGEWWFTENVEDVKKIYDDNKKDLKEIHSLTLVHIWKDALSWVNENILP